ncbi:MAG: ABC transporter permease [Vicinamibacterales bacterium]
MAFLTRLVGGLVGLLRRTRQEQELDAELQEFLEMAIEDKVRAGMSRETATRAARMELGSAAAVKDRVRDVGWENVLETTWQDLRYAARTLRRSPGFTAVAVVSLALGIGANTATFSLINTLMLRSLPVSHPEQLVELLSRYPGEPRMSSFGWRHYEHFRDHNQSFSDLLAVARGRFHVSGEGLEPETIDGEYVAGNFFTALDVRPALGRLIDARDDQADSASAASAVVSWSYWTNRLHADPAIVGKVIVVNDVPATVVGVAPREFFGLQVGIRPSVWVPAAMEPLLQKPSRRMDGTLSVGMMGRLKPGVTIEQALAEMRVLDRYRLEDMAKTRQSASVRDITIELEPAAAGFAALRDRFATSLLVLMAVVALLLLIACINVASMLLARGAARQHEMALRVSLGAGRVRLVRQVLTESLLLSADRRRAGVRRRRDARAHHIVRTRVPEAAAAHRDSGAGRSAGAAVHRHRRRVDRRAVRRRSGLACLDLCAGTLAARTRSGWRDTIAPTVCKEPRRGSSRRVCRAPERCRFLRTPPLEPAEPGLRLSARVLAAGHAGPSE